VATNTAAQIEIQPIAAEHNAPLYLAALESIDDTYPWMEWCHPGLTREEIAADTVELIQQSERREAYVFAVLDLPSRAFAGLTGINRIHWQDRYANLWYWIRSSRTGQGLAALAARQTASYGFQALDLQRIEVVVACGNPRSRRVALKLGAIEEGLARNRCRHHGSQSDAFMFSLIPSDLGGGAAA
jgi:RimJ/RimL family protein N-acetyltransferase